MASFDSTKKRNASQGAGRQPDRPFGLLRRILDATDIEPIVEALEAYRLTGRPGYHPRAMLRAYFSRFLLKVRTTVELVEKLEADAVLREVCGLGDEVPSESTFCRFFKRLAGHMDLVTQCLDQAFDGIHGIMPKVPRRRDKYGRLLPHFGKALAIDSTLFSCYANPHSGKDPHASWGYKNSAKSKDGKPILGWGYKMQMVCDAVYGVPVAFTITPAKDNDHESFPDALALLKQTRPSLKPDYLLADKGYDSLAIHQKVVNAGITPVIDIREPTADDGLYDGIYNPDGRPLCLGNVEMDYQGTDPETGQHLFRCPAGGCHLLGKGLVPNCRDELWVDPADNPRVLGKVPRFTKVWKNLYKLRTSVERLFSGLKYQRGLEEHQVMGMEQNLLQSHVAVLTYSATQLAHLQAGDYDRIGKMRVRRRHQ